MFQQLFCITAVNADNQRESYYLPSGFVRAVLESGFEASSK
jgi:hypothetical protein